MQTNYINFNIEHIPDNEAMYFILLQNIIHSIDSYAYATFIKNPDSYIVRISLLKAGRTNDLVKQLNTYNNACNLKVSYGKSLKAGNIFFKIDINPKNNP